MVHDQALPVVAVGSVQDNHAQHEEAPCQRNGRRDPPCLFIRVLMLQGWRIHIEHVYWQFLLALKKTCCNSNGTGQQFQLQSSAHGVPLSLCASLSLSVCVCACVRARVVRNTATAPPRHATLCHGIRARSRHATPYHRHATPYHRHATPRHATPSLRIPSHVTSATP